MILLVVTREARGSLGWQPKYFDISNKYVIQWIKYVCKQQKQKTQECPRWGEKTEMSWGLWDFDNPPTHIYLSLQNSSVCNMLTHGGVN